MKTRIAAAVASLLVASMGAAAYAQGAQETTPQTPPPPTTSSYMTHNPSTMNTQSSQVAQEVKQQLMANGVTATNVDVSFSNGTATLSGTVATQADINKARAAAMRVQGVKNVDTSNLQARAQPDQMQH